MVESQQSLFDKNEQQYIVGKNSFGMTNQLVKKIVDLISRINNSIPALKAEEIVGLTLIQIIAIKEDNKKTVRVCQLTKSGIFNTNLSAMKEILQIVSEVQSLTIRTKSKLLSMTAKYLRVEHRYYLKC